MGNKVSKGLNWTLGDFDCIEKTVSPQYFPDFTLLENVQNRNPQIKRSTCAEQYLQCSPVYRIESN